MEAILAQVLISRFCFMADGACKAGFTFQIYNGHGRCHELRTP